MQCEKCDAVVELKQSSCPKCGAPVPQNIAEFDNTIEFQRQLRAIVVEHGARAVADPIRFVGLLNDYLPDDRRERRLLENMYRFGVFRMLIEEGTREIALMKAKRFMQAELFITENAAEFVLACFTYLLGWVYESPLKVYPNQEPTAEPEEQKPRQPLNMDEMVFTPVSALKFRLTGNIVIPEGYTKLDAFCFDKFTSLRTISLPQSLLYIGDYAFSACKRLRGVELPEGLRIIKQGAFSQCSALVVVKIPDGVLEIEDSTFSFCTSLETLEVPDSVSSIGAEAFSGCESLRKLFLPESIKFIDVNAFSFCSKLVIYCIENSYVHKYCIVNGIRYIPVTQREL